MRINQAVVGLVIGLITPLFGFIIVYFILGHGQDFSSFISDIQSSPSLAAKVISLCALANLAPFLYFNSRRLDQTVKGIVIATMLYLVAFLYVKFVM